MAKRILIWWQCMKSVESGWGLNSHQLSPSFDLTDSCQDRSSCRSTVCVIFKQSVLSRECLVGSMCSVEGMFGGINVFCRGNVWWDQCVILSSGLWTCLWNSGHTGERRDKSSSYSQGTICCTSFDKSITLPCQLAHVLYNNQRSC